MEPRSFAVEAYALTTRPTRWSSVKHAVIIVVSDRERKDRRGGHWSLSGCKGSAVSRKAVQLRRGRVCLLVGCLTSQQHASVSQGRICSDNFTCSHTEIEVADQTFHLIQSQYTDTGPTSPSADPITPGAWQGSHWSAKCLSHWYDSTPKKSRASGIRTRDLPLSRRTPYH